MSIGEWLSGCLMRSVDISTWKLVVRSKKFWKMENRSRFHRFSLVNRCNRTSNKHRLWKLCKTTRCLLSTNDYSPPCHNIITLYLLQHQKSKQVPYVFRSTGTRNTNCACLDTNWKIPCRWIWSRRTIWTIGFSWLNHRTAPKLPPNTDQYGDLYWYW